jgi:hypothetical protein
MLPHVEKRRVMNCVLCVGTPPTFVTVDGVWGSVGYIWWHLGRDQDDTPELGSNMLLESTGAQYFTKIDMIGGLRI